MSSISYLTATDALPFVTRARAHEDRGGIGIATSSPRYGLLLLLGGWKWSGGYWFVRLFVHMEMEVRRG